MALTRTPSGYLRPTVIRQATQAPQDFGGITGAIEQDLAVLRKQRPESSTTPCRILAALAKVQRLVPRADRPLASPATRRVETGPQAGPQQP